MKRNKKEPIKINAEHDLGTGLGDCVTMAWMPDCFFYVESKTKKELFTLLGRELTDDIAGATKMVKAFQRDLTGMSHRPRVDSWMRALRIKGAPKRPKLNISEPIQKWAKQWLGKFPNPVLLFPKSKVTSRIWPAAYWIELSWLLKARGFNVFTFIQEKDSTFELCPNCCWGFSLEQLAAIMQHAKLVVGNDSVAAHLAGTVGANTLVMGGPTIQTVYSHCGKCVKVVQTKRVPCVGCCFKPPFRGTCDIGCLALYGLFPTDVLLEVDKLEL